MQGSQFVGLLGFLATIASLIEDGPPAFAKFCQFAEALVTRILTGAVNMASNDPVLFWVMVIVIILACQQNAAQNEQAKP